MAAFISKPGIKHFLDKHISAIFTSSVKFKHFAHQRGFFFINDVSFYATEAADKAPRILPKLETWKDIGKSPISAQDNKALAAPIFEGTLSWTRDAGGKPVRESDPQKAGIVWTNKELVDQFKLTPYQISLHGHRQEPVESGDQRYAALCWQGCGADP